MRRLGNCELFAKAVSENISFEHDLRLVRLPSLNILPCTGCYRCLNDGMCWIEDDIPFLIEQIVSADALIIASPVYFLGTHGCVKALLDRAFAFFSALESMARKPCLLVNTYGMKDRVGVSPQALLTLASFLGLEVKASVNLQAALPGDILATKRHIDTAARLGKLLFGEKRRRKEGRTCPFCGMDIIRVRRADFICTLCHGSFLLDQQGRAVKGRPGWDVGSAEFVRSHREWLKGMKERFLANRKELIALSLPYRDVGQWIEPVKLKSRTPGENPKKSR
jgi:multimeric flavodoxin WrbA